MITTSTSPKIKSMHLSLLAVVYVRQSTDVQVKYNTVGRERQYDLKKLAVRLGWPAERVTINDEDLGKSGASIHRRTGFKRVKEMILEGKVGAVFSLCASRLSREMGDFVTFVKLCYLMNTLIIDEEDVYDTHISSDRMVLGFKGMIADAERNNIVTQLQRAKEKKAEDGTLRTIIPTGYVYNKENKIVLSPSKKVRERLQLAFEQFDRLGTALAVVKHFTDNSLSFPTKIKVGENRTKITWVRLSLHRLLHVLHNPVYTGAFVYGRTRTEKDIVSLDTLDFIGRHVNLLREEWMVLIRDHHPAYITWEQYLKNEKRLGRNRCLAKEDCPGAPRSGSALLSGLIKCKKCNLKMHPKYPYGGRDPFYTCRVERFKYGGKRCQGFTGVELDRTVAELFLKAFSRSHLTVALQTLKKQEERVGQHEDIWAERIKRAKTEATKAERRYKVAADNKGNVLVAAQLAEEWEAMKLAVGRLERERDDELAITPRVIDEKTRKAILSLADDLPAIWHSPTTTVVERKELLRFAIQEITLQRAGSVVHAELRWLTGAHHKFEVFLPGTRFSPEADEKDAQILKMVLSLRGKHTHQHIAERLNEEGYSNKRGGVFTSQVVKKIIKRFGCIAH